MNALIKGLFRPISNRRYNPHHLMYYLLINTPGAIIFLLLGIFVSPWFLIWLVQYPLDYLILDRVGDSFWWNFLGKRFYGSEVHEDDPEYFLVNNFDKDPTELNASLLVDSSKRK